LEEYMRKRTKAMAIAGLLALAFSLQAFAASSGIVTGKYVNIRNAASMSGQVLDVAPKGAEISVFTQEGQWWQIEYNGTSGYMFSDYISIVQPTAAEPVAIEAEEPAKIIAEEQVVAVAEAAPADSDIFAAFTGVVTASKLNVRAEASMDATVIALLSRNATVNVTDRTGNWYKISFDDAEAYVFADYIATQDGLTSRGVDVDRTVYSGTGTGIVDCARSMIGVPYVYGGTTTRGFDCSGLVQYVMKKCGYSVPRTASAQYAACAHISKPDLQPGDMVFFKPSSSAKRISHVGIYIGNGQMIHSPKPGDSVKISSVFSGHFSTRYYGAARAS
jgi:cell wall-associated NlpC family hydrolase